MRGGGSEPGKGPAEVARRGERVHNLGKARVGKGRAVGRKPRRLGIGNPRRGCKLREGGRNPRRAIYGGGIAPGCRGGEGAPGKERGVGDEPAVDMIAV